MFALPGLYIGINGCSLKTPENLEVRSLTEKSMAMISLVGEHIHFVQPCFERVEQRAWFALFVTTLTTTSSQDQQRTFPSNR